MAKLALQLQSIVIVLTFLLIVINHYVCGTSEPLRIYRGDYDTFDNPTCFQTGGCTNCTAMNANCSRYDDTDHSRCLECTCFGQYKTYLRYFGRCVRDNKLLFFPVGQNSFMIQKYQSKKCITYNGSDQFTAANCNSNDSSQRWIWTRYSQLLHVETSECIQQGQMFPGKNDIWYLDLEECNISEAKQNWSRDALYLRRSFRHANVLDYLYITFHENLGILATLQTVSIPTNWECYKSTQTPQQDCSLPFGCNAFANPSSPMLVINKHCQYQGKQQIADLPRKEKCCVMWDKLQYLDYNIWKKLNSTKKIFSISNRMSGRFLNFTWDLTTAPSNWSNLIIKLNFYCATSEQLKSSAGPRSTGCVLIKLKNSFPDCPTTASSTVSSSEAATPKSPTRTATPKFPTRMTTLKSSIRTTSSKNSNGTLKTSHAPSTTSPPPSTKLPTSSKEKQKGESSSVVGIVVGLIAAIVALCGIILGFFCYKRRKSRSVDKTSSNVEINGKGQSSGDTLNPIYSSEDNNNPSFSNDGGIYQEPDGNISAASQACDLYEPADDHEYDYAKVEQKNKPAPPLAELEYDYAKTDDIKSAVQRLPVKGNDYQDTIIKNKNASTDANEDKETENETGPLYQTLEDDTGPVYQTLDSE